MINKIDLKRRPGFLGNAKSTTKAPYRQIKRVPEMYSFGENTQTRFFTEQTFTVISFILSAMMI